jgi:hypothetical protein
MPICRYADPDAAADDRSIRAKRVALWCARVVRKWRQQHAMHVGLPCCPAVLLCFLSFWLPSLALLRATLCSFLAELTRDQAQATGRASECVCMY